MNDIFLIGRVPTGREILSTLIELYAEQEGLEVTYTIVED